jgi:uncharacterized protein with GYD domain
MTSAPGDRTAAVRQVISSLGGSLECIYWMVGPYDGIAIAEMPDSVSAAAVHIAVAGTGTITSNQTYELFTQEQLGQALSGAKTAAQVFQLPGQPS